MLREMLYSIDPNTMVLMLLFIILFAFLNWILFRFFKNRGTSGVIAFCISALAVYGLNRTGFDISGWFYGIGISEGVLYTAVPILVLAFLIFLIWKIKLFRTLTFLGALLIIASFTPLIYEKTWILVIGVVLFVVGIILWIRKRGKDKKKDKIGNINPKFSNTKSPSNQREIEKQQRQQQEQQRQQGIDLLIKAAKRFKSWARAQPNPKFVGSWAMFINYLKRNRWGNSESEICQRLGISRNDFVRIFNRYGKV